MPDISNLTSGQYAYLLLRQLQRDISCDWKGDRMAALTYFGAVFKDPSVVLTYSVYLEFSALMGEDIEYCAAHKLHELDDIINSTEAKNKFIAPIKNTFSKIGCTVDDSNLMSGELTITSPSGTAYIIHGSAFDGAGSNEYLRSQLGCTDEYWDEIKRVYAMGDEQLLSIDDIEHRRCGSNATFSVTGTTLYINGTGEVVGQRAKQTLSSARGSLFSMTSVAENATTVVLGAGIDTLTDNCLDIATSMTIVCLRAENDPMTLSAAWPGDASTSTKGSQKSLVIYADNLALRAYQFNSKYTVTWHPLSEWEG